jgi:hypothetical protein
MHRAGLNMSTIGGKVVLGLLTLMLAMRLLVPAGWMPVAGNGYAITLCTGMGAVSAWVDEDGNIHKQKPGSNEISQQPCAFSGFAAALTAPELPAALAPIAAQNGIVLAAALGSVAIGRGLAAPPPPPTGPPASL